MRTALHPWRRTGATGHVQMNTVVVMTPEVAEMGDIEATPERATRRHVTKVMDDETQEEAMVVIEGTILAKGNEAIAANAIATEAIATTPVALTEVAHATTVGDEMANVTGGRRVVGMVAVKTKKMTAGTIDKATDAMIDATTAATTGATVVPGTHTEQLIQAMRPARMSRSLVQSPVPQAGRIGKTRVRLYLRACWSRNK